MRYVLDIQQTARREFRALSPEIARRIVGKLEILCDDLSGDVKRFTGNTSAYRFAGR